MTLFRVEHNKNYTTVNNTICKDKRVSWAARGIWLYAFSKPNDWKFYLADLINQTDAGKDAVNSALKNLQDCGYLRRTKIRNSNGTFAHDDWTFFETPIDINEEGELKFKQPQAENPSTVNPPKVRPAKVNPPLLSTDSLPNTEVKQVLNQSIKEDEDLKKEEEKDPGIFTYTNGKFQQVNMSAFELNRYLIRKGYSEEIVKEAIDRVKNFDGHIDNIERYIVTICRNLSTEKREARKNRHLNEVFSEEKVKSNVKKVVSPEEKARIEAIKKEMIRTSKGIA